jgi:hypothetical protein
MSSSSQADTRLEEGTTTSGPTPEPPERVEAEDSPVNFDEPAVAELEIDGTDYRLDSGRAGTALCISTRASGTWDWSFRGEARWQSNVLRCKAFDREVLNQLSKALAEAAAGTD